MNRVTINTIDDAVYTAIEGSQCNDFVIDIDIDGIDTELIFDLSSTGLLEGVRIDLSNGRGGLMIEYSMERNSITPSQKFIQEVIPDLHHAICDLEYHLDVARGSYVA